MRSFVLLLCIAYAAAGAVHQVHHNNRPTPDVDDLGNEKLRIYVSNFENSGAIGKKVKCILGNKDRKNLWSKEYDEFEAGQHYDKTAYVLDDEIPFPESNNYTLSCYSLKANGDKDGTDALFIRKIQYKYNATTCFQARVMNVFDDEATCNTANMRMNEIRTDCPERDDLCVGFDFKYQARPDGNGKSCQSCRNPTADGDSPCGKLHAEDIGDKNGLGYSLAGKKGYCPEHQHLCSKPPVSGRAKCCHEIVDIRFYPKKDYIDDFFNWGRK